MTNKFLPVVAVTAACLCSRSLRCLRDNDWCLSLLWMRGPVGSMWSQRRTLLVLAFVTQSCRCWGSQGRLFVAAFPAVIPVERAIIKRCLSLLVPFYRSSWWWGWRFLFFFFCDVNVYISRCCQTKLHRFSGAPRIMQRRMDFTHVFLNVTTWTSRMSRFEYAGAFKRHGTLNFMPFGASMVSRMAKISLSMIVGKRWPSRWEKTAMRIFPVQYELTPDTRPGATMLQGKPHIGALVMTRRRTSNFGYQTKKNLGGRFGVPFVFFQWSSYDENKK